MPKKIGELKQMLRKAGWMNISGGKGSHSKWFHPKGSHIVVLSGNDGRDARRYQEQEVERAVEEANE